MKFALGKHPVLAGALEAAAAALEEAAVALAAGGAPATALARPPEAPDDEMPPPEASALLRAARPAAASSRFSWLVRELTTRLWADERCSWAAEAETRGVAMVSSESAVTVKEVIEVLIVCSVCVFLE